MSGITSKVQRNVQAQRSHWVWKTWKFEQTFSSQGKVRENDHFGQFLEKSAKKLKIIWKSQGKKEKKAVLG